MPSSPPVLAVCVNWNGGSLLGQTVEALLRSDYPDLRILVVDAASSDGSWVGLPAEVELLSLPENRGYAAALNRGVRHAEKRWGEDIGYFLLMNNDIRLAPDCISLLVAADQEKGPGICGPAVLQWRRPDRLEAAWGELRWHHVLAGFRHRNTPDPNRDTTSRRVELLLGCALLVPRNAWLQIGPWDESYFMYHEEIDFLYRAERLSIPAIWVPRAKAFHWGGWGTGDPLRKVFWVRRNTVYFFRKHRASPGKWACFAASMAASLAWNLVTLRWRRLRSIVSGLQDGFQMEVKNG